MTTTESKSVKLCELEHDPVSIAGREERLERIDDLLASIPAMGQLQSLRVRPWPEAGEGLPLYAVVAGNRRLATLRRLAQQGGAIQGVVVDPDYMVNVIVGREDDAGAYAASVAENVQRLPETPVGEFRAFARMAETMKPAEIAAAFGVPERRVQQRLKLASLHEDVVAALDTGRITMEAAEAFTLAETDEQATYLKKASGYQLDAYQIRNKFTARLIDGDSIVARLIGAKAYQKAGGRVLQDEFSETVYWLDARLIDRLLAEHWKKQVAIWIAAGWSFVETFDEFVGRESWKLYSCERLEPEGEEGDVPRFSAEEMKTAGVVYDPAAQKAPILGIKRWVKPPAQQHTPTVSLAVPPAQVNVYLRTLQQDAIEAAVRADPMFCVRLLVAQLKENAASWHSGTIVPFEINREFAVDEGEDEEEPERDFELVLDELLGLADAEILAELARVLAQGVNVPAHRRQVLPARLTAIVAPAFDPRAYFEGGDRAFLALAWQDMTDPAGNEKSPKAGVEMLNRAVQRATDTGWLPPQLRAQDYAGPAFTTSADDAGDTDDAGDDEDEDHLEAAE